ncbi:MAG: hypothetical protein P8L36_04460, partial [SAR324 cluster bacterium]|nr:hypothetical protein [SAR324 cluster bacterium]
NGGSILEYSGAEVSLGKILTLGGSGQLQNTNDLNLGAGGKLKLSAVSVAKVITSANSLGLEIESDSSISNFAVGNITPVSIASGKSLSGSIVVNAGGKLEFSNTGTLASAISMNGGILDANESLTISGAVTQAGNATIDVISGKTITFGNGSISTESHELTLLGAGTVAFPANAYGIILNNPAGLLRLDGSGTLGAAKVNAASDPGKGILVNETRTITNLNISADTELKIANGMTLYGSADVVANKTLSLNGTGTLNSALNLKGTLLAGANLTVSGLISVTGNSALSIPGAATTVTYTGGNLKVGANTLSIGGAGTFSNNESSPLVLDLPESILDLTGNGKISGAVRLEGCTLKASGSPTITGDITQYDDATIEVASNQTLSYSGASLNLGANKLTLTGGGTFNNSNALILNHAHSLLSLEGIGTTGNVNATVNASSGKGIQVVESVTIENFDLTATSNLNIADTKTIGGQIKLNNNSELNISGTGEFTGGMQLVGGKLSVGSDKNFTGTLSFPEESEIEIAQGSTLKLQQGGDISLGDKILFLSGNGSLKFQNSINVNDGEIKASGAILNFAAGGSVDKLTLESATLVLNGDLSIGDKLKTSGTDPTMQLNGKNLDLSATNVKIELGTGLVMDGVSTSTNTALILTSDASLSRGSPFTLGTVNLQNKSLSLGSGTSDLTVSGSVTFDSSSSQLLTGEADLTLQSALSLANGKLSSTGGTLSLQQGLTLGSGAIFDFTGSTVKFSGTLNVGDGTITSSSSSILELQAASSFSSNAEFTIPTLDLNSQALTLNTSSTHLTLSNPFAVGASESVDTQAGSLTLNGSATLEDNGIIESSAGSLTFNDSVTLDSSSIFLTGGSVAFNSAAQISGGELKLYESALILGADVNMTDNSTLRLKSTDLSGGTEKVNLTGGTLEFGGNFSDFDKINADSTTAFSMNDNTIISSDAPMEIGGLELNNFTLTLGSATTDLTIQTALKLESSGSELITNGADLNLPNLLLLNAGKVTSSGGTVTLTQGATLANGSTLDLSGTTLKLQDDLSAENGILTTNESSVLHLLDNVTVTFSEEKTFKTLQHNSKTLTLGTATSDLKLLDPLELSSVTLHTGNADLNLQGTLSLQSNSLLDSTGGTLKLGGTVDSSSEISLPGTELALNSDLAIYGTLSTGSGSTISRNTRELNLSGGLLKLAGDLELAGTITDETTNLTLQSSSTLGNSVETKFGTIDLNGSALSVTMSMSINEPLILDNAGEQILTGTSGLTLNDSLAISAGKLSSQSGLISLGSTVNLGAGGIINMQGGELQLSDNLSVVGGNLILDDQVKLNLNNDVSISSNRPLSIGTLEMNNHNLTVNTTENAGLSVKKAFTLNNASTLQMNGADLTFSETAVIGGVLEPSGGRLTFQKGGSVSGTLNSKNSTLALQTTDLVFTGLLQTNASTTLDGANLLNLSDAKLDVEGSLTLDDVTTSSSTELKLYADTTINKNAPFTLRSVDLTSNILTLGTADTDLTINNSTPAEGGSAGTFKIQDADLTWTGPVGFSTAKIYSTGGTLTLPTGSSLSGNGLISVANGSSLVLKGTFGQSGGEFAADTATLIIGGDFTKTGGSLTSTNTNLELSNDAILSSDQALSFKALTLNNKMLTLGGQAGSFSLSDELKLNNPNGLIVQNSTSLILNGGVSIDSGGVLSLSKGLDTGNAKIKLNGGLLEIESEMTISSSIEHLAPSTLEIAQTKALTYEGASIAIGASALSIIGGGTFSNTNPLELDHAASKLLLSSITVDNVSTSVDNSLGVVVEDNSTLSSFAVRNITPVSIFPNQSLNGSINVYQHSNLQLNNTGTLAANVTISGLGGTVEAQKSMTFSGSLQQVDQHEGFELIIASGETMTYSGS